MRVIAGTAKGRRLKEPSDKKIRPTTDKVKESLFNIIQFSMEGARVLDLFGGTGQLGIEALSRGAVEAIYTDLSAEAVHIIKENLRCCGFENRARVFRGEALSLLGGLGKFDIIFLDPPYGTGLLESALSRIIEFDILSGNGIIIAEFPSDAPAPFVALPYSLYREYRYGKIMLAVYTREDIL